MKLRSGAIDAALNELQLALGVREKFQAVALAAIDAYLMGAHE
jgi:hypothetical protein